jgi:hypothetical protein
MSRRMISRVLLVALAIAAVPTMAQQRGRDTSQDRTGSQAADRVRQAEQDRISDRDRAQDRDLDRDRDRDTLRSQDRDRLHDADFYGTELMTAQEREQYRERLQAAQTDQQWAQIRAQHEDQMQARAEQRGVDLPAPIYGQFMMTAREQERYRERVESARNERRQAHIRAEYQERMRSRARQLGVDLPAQIYGQQLMSEEEQARYRRQLQAMSSEAERERFAAQHRGQMQARAREYRVPLDELEAG